MDRSVGNRGWGPIFGMFVPLEGVSVGKNCFYPFRILKFEKLIHGDMKGWDTALSSVLILVFGYTGLEKFLRFEQSRNAFRNQTFPTELAEILVYAVPGVELLLALLLLFSVTRWWGYLGSALLLTVFITYVGLIWVGAFPRVPCNCAGLIDSMGWAAHFWINLGLIGMAVWGLKLEGLYPPTP